MTQKRVQADMMWWEKNVYKTVKIGEKNEQCPASLFRSRAKLLGKRTKIEFVWEAYVCALKGTLLWELNIIFQKGKPFS